MVTAIFFQKITYYMAMFAGGWSFGAFMVSLDWSANYPIGSYFERKSWWDAVFWASIGTIWFIIARMEYRLIQW